MKSKICILQSSNCSADSCSRSRMFYKNFQKHSSQLAYIAQTSGTTGEPKIVQVPHHCIVPNILDLRSRFNVKPDDVILQCTPLTFDPSVIEVFLAASSGSALVIIPHILRSMPKKLMQVIEDAKI
ncbi:Acyl-CoA synthetase family member 4, partial [Stegodyphus mimosarum]